MAFLNEHYPSCSSYYKQKIAFRTSRRRWNDVTIGKAVGITVTNYVRHHMTQYEYLMGALKLTREEARIVVAEEVKDIWQSWQQPRLDTTPADDASAAPTDQ
ncbi:DUF2293 domain-containing protein [Cohaesibacter intestini]|uniref:DUF2293 domain-containing protein n=1 Tax=Cohaesibacter intestini TaxID=2211145 RepID=UPI000DE9C777|nr:DUF2293 domain-containing protein [Cohaesibacter intestini]